MIAIAGLFSLQTFEVCPFLKRKGVVFYVGPTLQDFHRHESLST